MLLRTIEVRVAEVLINLLHKSKLHNTSPNPDNASEISTSSLILYFLVVVFIAFGWTWLLLSHFLTWCCFGLSQQQRRRWLSVPASSPSSSRRRPNEFYSRLSTAFFVLVHILSLGAICTLVFSSERLHNEVVGVLPISSSSSDHHHDQQSNSNNQSFCASINQLTNDYANNCNVVREVINAIEDDGVGQKTALVQIKELLRPFKQCPDINFNSACTQLESGRWGIVIGIVTLFAILSLILMHAYCAKGPLNSYRAFRIALIITCTALAGSVVVHAAVGLPSLVILELRGSQLPSGRKLRISLVTHSCTCFVNGAAHQCSQKVPSAPLVSLTDKIYQIVTQSSSSIPILTQKWHQFVHDCKSGKHNKTADELEHLLSVIRYTQGNQSSQTDASYQQKKNRIPGRTPMEAYILTLEHWIESHIVPYLRQCHLKINLMDSVNTPLCTSILFYWFMCVTLSFILMNTLYSSCILIFYLMRFRQSMADSYRSERLRFVPTPIAGVERHRLRRRPKHSSDKPSAPLLPSAERHMQTTLPPAYTTVVSSETN
ncbi:hypothetical protein ACOME3_001585 [Neoechinorhynchus agilis]